MSEAAAGESSDAASAFAAALSVEWKDRQRFVVLDDRFDGGIRFLRCLQVWRADPHRCAQLHVVTLSRDIAEGRTAPPLDEEIGDTWPPITPNMHRLSFDDGQVQWLLGPTDFRAGLRELLGPVDAFSLVTRVETDAAGARRQAKALARLARMGSLACFEAASITDVDAMGSAGFRRVADHSDHWRYAPSFTPRRMPSRTVASALANGPVVVIGAGLAGCAMAWALAEQGRDSIVLERHGALAMETSGNPAGLFHGIVNPQDGAHARFNRAAALEAQRAVLVALAQHGVQGSAQGLLRLETAHDGADALPAMQNTVRRLTLPPDYVQAMSAREASARSGWTLPHPAWWYPGGGWVQPAGLARSFIERARRRATLSVGCAVESLTREASGWVLRDANGHTLATSDTVVLANAGDALRLLRPSMPPSEPDAWPLLRVRGQISMARLSQIGTLSLPLIPITGAGYLLPPIDGLAIFGATSQPGDDDASVRDSDHQHNLARLSRLTGAVLQIDPTQLAGRTGWRWTTDDRLPVLGAVPDIAAAVEMQRLEHASQVPRLPGLYACTGFGSRGITWAALAAQVVAASITGAPVPIEASLLDSVDAARFVIREAARRSRRGR
jgi:tRNA 5-methylaminomethyl-2-thiouridine biosynthesis bifunctional protein